jgi:hypothetical protein
MKWVEYVKGKCWVRLDGRYMIDTRFGGVKRWEASDFPIRDWRNPTPFPSVEAAQAAD